MFFIAKEKYIQKQEEKWQREKMLHERSEALKEEKQSLKTKNKKTTTKLLIWFLFVNCTLIELFVGYVTVKSFTLALNISCNPDFSPLVTLVGAVVSEVIGYAIYAAKSAKENSVGGITYDMAMRNQIDQFQEEKGENEDGIYN